MFHPRLTHDRLQTARFWPYMLWEEKFPIQYTGDPNGKSNKYAGMKRDMLLVLRWLEFLNVEPSKSWASASLRRLPVRFVPVRRERIGGNPGETITRAAASTPPSGAPRPGSGSRAVFDRGRGRSGPPSRGETPGS